LDIALDGTVMVKAGSIIGYTGDVTFTGKSSAEGGITGFVKGTITDEGTPVMEADGSGHLYVADQGKKIQILDLDGDESISVTGNDVLAFESTVDYEIGTVGGISEAVAGGLTNVYLTGPGAVAITTHGDPLVVTPPVNTDPDATVAWSTDLSPSVATNKAIEIGQTRARRSRWSSPARRASSSFSRTKRAHKCRVPVSKRPRMTPRGCQVVTNIRRSAGYQLFSSLAATL
jgi:uncharacterized protein (AIM24 family)